jgi:ferredoxin-NADP reductase
VARAALPGRLTDPRATVAWRLANVIGLIDETAYATTILLAVPDWPGHIAGQHLDVRLVAEDGYKAIGCRRSDCVLHIHAPSAGRMAGFARRHDAETLTTVGPAPARLPGICVCGPTAFVEQAAELFTQLGHAPSAIRSERFGPTGSADPAQILRRQATYGPRATQPLDAADRPRDPRHALRSLVATIIPASAQAVASRRHRRDSERA